MGMFNRDDSFGGAHILGACPSYVTCLSCDKFREEQRAKEEVARQEATAKWNKDRRARIADDIKALVVLSPYVEEGDQEARLKASKICMSLPDWIEGTKFNNVPRVKTDASGAYPHYVYSYWIDFPDAYLSFFLTEEEINQMFD